MKIFIDTANLKDIKTALSWGVVDGVTTNPSLIKKAAEKSQTGLKQYISEILHVAGPEHPVSLEVLGGSVYEMISQGRCLYDLFNDVAKNVVIKIPVCSSICPDGERAYDGIKAIRVLSSKGIPVNTTLIMSPEQALLAAKAGAKYVSPFVGRIDDLLHNKQDDNGVVSGVDLVAKIVKIFKNYNLKTEVLAASIRNTQHVCEVALAGAHIATVPCNILYQMVAHPKTYEGMKKFTDDIVPEYRALFV